jgi:hypothetical protein
MSNEEKPYRAETRQAPLAVYMDNGYDSWIELVTPNFSMECHNPHVEKEEVEELAEMLNKSATMEQAIKDVLDVLDARNGVPNVEWVKNRLLEAIK